jgi:hypothetical protein
MNLNCYKMSLSQSASYESGRAFSKVSALIIFVLCKPQYTDFENFFLDTRSSASTDPAPPPPHHTPWCTQEYTQAAPLGQASETPLLPCPELLEISASSSFEHWRQHNAAAPCQWQSSKKEMRRRIHVCKREGGRESSSSTHSHPNLFVARIKMQFACRPHCNRGMW